jgi:hypothetical protein
MLQSVVLEGQLLHMTAVLLLLHSLLTEACSERFCQQCIFQAVFQPCVM